MHANPGALLKLKLSQYNRLINFYLRHAVLISNSNTAYRGAFMSANAKNSL